MAGVRQRVRLRVIRTGAVLATAALTAWPLPASAQRCIAPPGTAAVDQYCENVASAIGDRPATTPSGASITPSVQAGLLKAGPVGQALARSVATTGRDGRPRRPARPVRSDAMEALAPPSRSPLSAIGAALGDGSTIGARIIGAFILLTIAMAGAAWRRSRP